MNGIISILIKTVVPYETFEHLRICLYQRAHMNAIKTEEVSITNDCARSVSKELTQEMKEESSLQI